MCMCFLFNVAHALEFALLRTWRAAARVFLVIHFWVHRSDPRMLATPQRHRLLCRDISLPNLKCARGRRCETYAGACLMPSTSILLERCLILESESRSRVDAVC